MSERGYEEAARRYEEARQSRGARDAPSSVTWWHYIKLERTDTGQEMFDAAMQRVEDDGGIPDRYPSE